MSDIRDAFIARTRTLVGQSFEAVRYVQLAALGDVSDTSWDFEDWHHAEVGVDLITSSGTMCVTWTDAFHPYGVDVFPATTMAQVLVPDSETTTVDASSALPWQERLGRRIVDLEICWDTLSVGPATSTTTGETVAPAFDVDVPTASDSTLLPDRSGSSLPVPNGPLCGSSSSRETRSSSHSLTIAPRAWDSESAPDCPVLR